MIRSFEPQFFFDEVSGGGVVAPVAEIPTPEAPSADVDSAPEA